LHELAVNNIKTIDDFRNMEIANLQVKEILEKGNHTEIIFDIRDD
jgi:hypothetical protein